jgi:menaquinone-dependent protoporphyrinogen IX oxidase
MATKKTLIAYETKQGATEGAAKIIAQTLCEAGFEVDLVNLKKQDTPDLADYQNVVVGAGVRGGRVYGTAINFLKNDFSGKKVAFYTSSSWGGTPGSYQSAIKWFVQKTMDKYPNVNFVYSEAFGGKIKYFKKTMLDNTDASKVKAWAKTLAEKFQ